MVFAALPCEKLDLGVVGERVPVAVGVAEEERAVVEFLGGFLGPPPVAEAQDVHPAGLGDGDGVGLALRVELVVCFFAPPQCVHLEPLVVLAADADVLAAEDDGRGVARELEVIDGHLVHRLAADRRQDAFPGCHLAHSCVVPSVTRAGCSPLFHSLISACTLL